MFFLRERTGRTDLCGDRVGGNGAFRCGKAVEVAVRRVLMAVCRFTFGIALPHPGETEQCVLTAVGSGCGTAELPLYSRDR